MRAKEQGIREGSGDGHQESRGLKTLGDCLGEFKKLTARNISFLTEKKPKTKKQYCRVRLSLDWAGKV